MIAYFQNSLVVHLGQGAASGSFAPLGLSDREIIQIETAQGLESFIKVVGAFDESRCSQVMTEAEANALISQRFLPRHEVVNETLMGVSLNQKMGAGTVELDQMDPLWGQEEQNQWLYEHGVLGIRKTQPSFFEVL